MIENLLEPWREFGGCSLLLLSVSDSQGFRILPPPLSKSKPPHLFCSNNIISVISSLPLPRRCRSLKTPTFLFLALLCSFCQLDTVTPFGSRLIHSFGCPSSSFNTTTFSISTITFSATADSDTTPSLLCSGPASTYWHRW